MWRNVTNVEKLMLFLLSVVIVVGLFAQSTDFQRNMDVRDFTIYLLKLNIGKIINLINLIYTNLHLSLGHYQFMDITTSF